MRPSTSPSLIDASTLEDAVVGIAKAIDPFIDLGAPLHESDGASIGVGSDAPRGLAWYIGSIGQLALLDRHAQPVDAGAGRTLGPGLAACLGAGAICRHLFGEDARPSCLSAWSLSMRVSRRPMVPTRWVCSILAMS